MKYKLIIFDFDGTLADSFPWFAKNINKAARLFNFKKVRDEDHEKLRSLGARQIMSYLNIKWWKVPFISMYMRKLMTADLAGIPLFNDIETLLKELKGRDISLAIVSSNSLENVQKVLGENSAVFSYFECGSSVFGKHKKFQQLLRKTGLLPAEVLCIGDEIRDVEAAKALQMHSGSVTWGYARTEALKKTDTDYIIKSVEDILRICEGQSDVQPVLGP